MDKEELTTNQAVLKGIIAEPVIFSHEYKGAFFYKSTLMADRKSDERDLIPVVFPGRALRGKTVIKGSAVTLKGQFRSRNTPGPERMKLVLYFYALEVSEDSAPGEGVLMEQAARYGDDVRNSVFLDGYLCRKPGYRITPKGRDITDIILAVNRNAVRTDYIPCIVWGRNALMARELCVGDRIRLKGRMQSRSYKKADGEGNETQMTAYEVSVTEFQAVGREAYTKAG